MSAEDKVITGEFKEMEDQTEEKEEIVTYGEQDKNTEDTDTPTIKANRIARFEKVSFDEFLAAYTPIWVETQKIIKNVPAGESFGYSQEELVAQALEIWEGIELPKRSTKGSAGYDFFFPYGHTEIPAGASLMIPTGIKAYIEPNWVLFEVPRSSFGMTCRIQFDNTIGIIDSDYYNNPKNEGHIFVKITNDSRDGLTCAFETQCKYCQGIFVPFGITYDDDVNTAREGGLGSTGA